ncbi:MAG: PIN domain-containing protein [Geminicoccaceae bacterium]
MSRVFVDSSVWVDHLRGIDSRETQLLRSLLRRLDPRAEDSEPNDVVVGDMVLLEVLRGIDDDGQRQRVRRSLLAFETVRIGGRVTALLAAEHYVALRRLGQTVRKAIDCLIAAWCIEHDVPLLQADRDFQPFARHRGLRLA